MSNYLAAINKAAEPQSTPSSGNYTRDHDGFLHRLLAPPPPGEYGELIQRLFQGPTAVAIVGTDVDKNVIGVSEGIAKELAASGKRVVLVPVENLLRMNPIEAPRETALMSTIARNVWLWPSPVGQPVGLLKPPEPGPAGACNWLDALRRNFDSILLDCPAPDTTFGILEVAAVADKTVMVVEAGRTSGQQVHRQHRALQLRGATLAGCILVRRG